MHDYPHDTAWLNLFFHTTPNNTFTTPLITRSPPPIRRYYHLFTISFPDVTFAMGHAPECKNGCITTKGNPRRHYEHTCPLVMKKKIDEMDFSCIYLRVTKLTTAEFAALQSTEPPPTSSAAITNRRNPSAEILSPSPIRGSRVISGTIPESPGTPTPRPPRRPMGSPIKQNNGPMVPQLLSDTPIDPQILGPRSMSITESSGPGSPTREEWEDDEGEEEPQRNTKDVKGALMIKSQSQEKEGSEVRAGKKRLTSEEVSFQPDKRKRETFYRNTSERLRENVRKIGIVTGCYGILYLQRHVLLSSLD